MVNTKKQEHAISRAQEFLSDLVKNAPLSDMPEDVLQKWIENLSTLQKTVNSALIPPQNSLEPKVWKTIKLGVGSTDAAGFWRHLKDAKIENSDSVNSMMSNPEFTVSTEEREVDLVVVSVADLGFKKGALRDKIYWRAKELGLEPCPPDVGPQLRLQYRDQPGDEWLLIGMEPIADALGHSRVFGVEHGARGLWLRSNWAYHGSQWRPNDLWVFVRPRK